MKNKLIQLYNTLGMIEVKGDNLFYLADSRRFLQQIIAGIDEDKKPAAKKDKEDEE